MDSVYNPASAKQQIVLLRQFIAELKCRGVRQVDMEEFVVMLYFLENEYYEITGLDA